MKRNIFEALFQSETNENFTISSSLHKDLCYAHYRQYERCAKQIACSLCDTKTTEVVRMGSMAQIIGEFYDKMANSVNPNDWMCSTCSKHFLMGKKEKPSLEDDIQSNDTSLKLKAKSVAYGIEIIKTRDT